MTALLRPFICFLKWQDKKLTALSMRAMKWLGRSAYPIHPKHLYDEQRNVFVHGLMRPGIVFLDIGSGSGSDCLYALEKGAAQVYGVEYNPESIALSRERLKAYEGRYEIFEADLEEGRIALPDDSADLINFSNVLEHLHNREGVLRELRRVLKPGGQLYISIPNRNTPWKKRQRACGLDSRDDEDHKIEYDRETLEAELRTAGLEIATKLHPIVPSLPVNGLIALSAVLSPRLYRALQRWKVDFVHKRPQHSIGWYFLCSNDAKDTAKACPDNQKPARAL